MKVGNMFPRRNLRDDAISEGVCPIDATFGSSGFDRDE
jgi:hypothetical protein